MRIEGQKLIRHGDHRRHGGEPNRAEDSMTATRKGKRYLPRTRPERAGKRFIIHKGHEGKPEKRKKYLAQNSLYSQSTSALWVQGCRERINLFNAAAPQEYFVTTFGRVEGQKIFITEDMEKIREF